MEIILYEEKESIFLTLIWALLDVCPSCSFLLKWSCCSVSSPANAFLPFGVTAWETAPKLE